GVVDGQHGGLRSRLLLELDARGGFAQFLKGELPRVPILQEVRGFLAAGPGKVRWREDGAIRADLYGGVFLFRGQDQAGDVAALLNRVAPVLVFVSSKVAQIVAQNVG